MNEYSNDNFNNFNTNDFKDKVGMLMTVPTKEIGDMVKSDFGINEVIVTEDSLAPNISQFLNACFAIKYKNVMKLRWDPYKDQPIEQASTLCYILRRVVNESEDRVIKLLEILDKYQALKDKKIEYTLKRTR